MRITHVLVTAYLNPFSNNNYLNLYKDKFSHVLNADTPDWAEEGHFLQDIFDHPDKIKKEKYDPTYIDESDDIPGRLQHVADEMVSQENLKFDDQSDLELDGLFGDVPSSLQQPESFYPHYTNHRNSNIDELRETELNLVENAIPTVHTKTHPDLINGMRYRKLGESDLIVSELCLGTSFYDNPAFIDLDHAQLIISKAFNEYGINFFDTGEFDPLPNDPKSWIDYHHRSLKTLLNFNRDQIVVSARICSSNLGKPHRGRYLSWIRKGLVVPTLESIEEGVDNILSASGLDYLDIISLDNPERYVPNSTIGEDTYCWGNEVSKTDLIEESINALRKIIEKGKARYIGLSNETIWGLYKYVQLTNGTKFKPVFIQNMYNMLHRNEFESGLAEISIASKVPLVAYGTMAGGILTGKYLDPERHNNQGADKVEEPIYQFDKRPDAIPEDWGHLSFGPQNARCNLFPETYHTHRTVWCQHVTGEYLKIARTFGMTLSQLAFKWNNTRHFIGSTIIAPRTIGQFKDLIGTLNYPFTQELENDIHEIYLRYRAPTMGGPQILTSADDPENAVSQNKFITECTTPIWSGGSFWPKALVKDEQIEKSDAIVNEKEFLLTIGGHLDVPNDRSNFNFRCWIERIEEDLPGEYFAVKEAKLFGWDRYKFRDYTLVYKTPDQYREDDTSDFHFYWKDNKVYVAPTTEKIRQFYENSMATTAIVQRRITEYVDMMKDKINFVRSFASIDKGWSTIDADGLYKRLLAHGIDITNRETIEKLFEDNSNKIPIVEDQAKQFSYYYYRKKFKKPEQRPPGMEDVMDPHVLNSTEHLDDELLIE